MLWIDITGMDPAASILDVEPGNATPSTAASWAWHRLRAEPNALARIYTMRSEWPTVQAAVATLPSRMRSRIRWWIADPTGYPHLCTRLRRHPVLLGAQLRHHDRDPALLAAGPQAASPIGAVHRLYWRSHDLVQAESWHRQSADSCR